MLTENLKFSVEYMDYNKGQNDKQKHGQQDLSMYLSGTIVCIPD